MKILVIRFSSLGDCVLLCPFLTHLRSHGAREVTIVTKSTYVAIFSAVPGVDRVIGLDPGGGVRGLFQIAETHRKNGYRIIDAHNNLRSRFLSWKLGGADARIPKYYRERMGLILFKRPTDIPSVRQRYNDLGLSLDFPPMGEYTGTLELPPSSEKKAADTLAGYTGKFIAAAPGSRWETKRWPVERYTELLSRIVEQQAFNVMLLGDENDRPVAETIERALGDKALNLAGRTSLLEAASLIKRTEGFIGNDSGLMHLAELVGVPVLALFGPTVEAFGYFPSLPASKVCERDLSCRPCSRNGSRRCPKGTRECLTEIPVDWVEDVFLDLLRGEGPQRYVLP